MLLSFCCSYYESGISKDLYVFLGPVISIPGGGVQHVVQVFLDWIQAKKFLRSLFVKFLANLGPSVDFAWWILEDDK